MKLKKAILVFMQNGDPLIVCDDLINVDDLTYSTETKQVDLYNNDSYDKINLRKVLAVKDEIGWLVTNAMMHEVRIPLITQMLDQDFSLEVTSNDQLKLYNGKVIIHKR